MALPFKFLDIFKKGGFADKVTDIVGKAIPDKDKASELKMQLIALMAAQQGKIAPYVRAILSILIFTVWLFFPEKMVGREETTRYIIYAIISFYFLADLAIDKWKRRK
jgi:hypothetical protein